MDSQLGAPVAKLYPAAGFADATKVYEYDPPTLPVRGRESVVNTGAEVVTGLRGTSRVVVLVHAGMPPAAMVRLRAGRLVLR